MSFLNYFKIKFLIFKQKYSILKLALLSIRIPFYITQVSVTIDLAEVLLVYTIERSNPLWFWTRHH